MIVQQEVMKQDIEEKRRQAQLLEEKGSYQEALKEYGDLIMYVDEGQIKEIRAHVARLLKEGPDLLEPNEEVRRFVVRAEFYAKEGKFVNAVDEYKKALNLAPCLPKLYKALAVNYAAVKEYKKAIDMMKIYLELCPDAGDAREVKDEIYRWEANME